MPAAIRLLAGILLARNAVCAAETAVRSVPAYSAASIVNSATNLPGPLAPNTIASLYGQDLASGTRAVSANDLNGGSLPTVLPGTGVTVSIGGIAARLYYVSPTQINFLVPADLRPGKAPFQVRLETKNGPEIDIQIAATAPGFYQLGPASPVCTLADGTVISPARPAQPGDVVIIYGTGFGQTTPPAPPGRLAITPDSIVRPQDAEVRLAGVPLGRSNLFYIGVTPGFAGLYQVNLRIPDDTPDDPELAISIAGVESPTLKLPVRRPDPAATLSVPVR